MVGGCGKPLKAQGDFFIWLSRKGTIKKPFVEELGSWAEKEGRVCGQEDNASRLLRCAQCAKSQGYVW